MTTPIKERAPGQGSSFNTAEQSSSGEHSNALSFEDKFLELQAKKLVALERIAASTETQNELLIEFFDPEQGYLLNYLHDMRRYLLIISGVRDDE